MYANLSQKQNVFIYIEDFEHYSIDKKWKDQKYNFGVGGTTFNQLRLISELQNNYKNFLKITALTDKSSDYIFPNSIKTYSFEILKSNNNENSIYYHGGYNAILNFLKIKIKKVLFLTSVC